MSEKVPESQEGEEADRIAKEMLLNLNKAAFDTIPYLSWEFFRPGQKYLWNKTINQAVIEWDDYKVTMNLNSQQAIATKGSVLLEADDLENIKSKAWSNWCNDSFWLIAPFKAFDPGTTRAVVKTEEAAYGLMISYKSGGVTPGDKYLWLLDKNYRPTGWKMWTQILPVQGMYTPWYGWTQVQGAWFSVKHKFVSKEVQLNKLMAGNHISDFGLKEDPFKELNNLISEIN